MFRIFKADDKQKIAPVAINSVLPVVDCKLWLLGKGGGGLVIFRASSAKLRIYNTHLLLLCKYVSHSFKYKPSKIKR